MTWPAIQDNVMTTRQWFIGCALLALPVAALVVTRFWFWSSDLNLWILASYFVPWALYVLGIVVIAWGSGRFREYGATVGEPSRSS